MTTTTRSTETIALPVASSATGLDQLVDIITADAGLQRKISAADIAAGAAAANEMNLLIVEAIRASGAANDGTINTGDVRDINTYLRANYLTSWSMLHGDDEGGSETGFHLVQNDGARTLLYGRNAVNAVADGLYHLGFEIQGGRLVNEDGDANARLDVVANWLNLLLKEDLAGAALDNPAVITAVTGTTGTGLDQLVEIMTSDVGLARRISTSDLVTGASAANELNQLIVDAIRATSSADGGTITVDEVREINAYLRDNVLESWTSLHGDDEDGIESGFHLLQADGASTALFGRNAVNGVADGLYHLGFEIENGRLVNEDGDANAALPVVADWLNTLLASDMAIGGSLYVPEASVVGVASGGGLSAF